jgi:type I restriction enzyme S subunit
VGITRRPVAINQDIKALICNGHAHADYIAHVVKAAQPTILKWVRATTADNFPVDNLRELKIPLPVLNEQRRIAEILDKAHALRRKRKRALELLDGLTTSMFLEMFGDPALNPNGYRLYTFGDIAEKISDGPFGSNLKSSHYVDEGIRVIRLQNIGVGEFLDDDQAYISEEHFKSLSKHACRRGDVLIATLGDPNLCACLHPEWLEKNINKADCVQLRFDPRQVLPEYVVSLINQPSTERMAHALLLGQTRTRISKGRLRMLAVPIAPLGEQRRFVKAIRAWSTIRRNMKTEAITSGDLFSCLQSRAFSGHL